LKNLKFFDIIYIGNKEEDDLMYNDPIVINAFGVYTMHKHNEWRDKIADEKGYLPVHRMHRQYMDAILKFAEENINFHGKEIPVTRVINMEPPEGVRKPTDEEFAVYHRAEDEWIAEEILRDWDWAHFVNYCKSNNIEDFVSGHYPCDGSDGQCQMDCEYLVNGRCPRA
jgi:hypothetical protein